MTRYLLDANILSDLIRNPRGVIADHVRRVGAGNVCTSIVVAAELRFGAMKKQSTRLTAQLETLLRGIEAMPFESTADAAYAYIRTALELQGKPIGSNDLPRTPWRWVARSSRTTIASSRVFATSLASIGCATG